MHRLQPLLAVLALVAGCYSPDLGNGPGFYCHAADNPACPNGQTCINGRCYSGTPPAGDGGGGDMSGSHDMATSSTPRDFAMQQQQFDFALPVSFDLSTGGGNLCTCASMCPITGLCVGINCCFEDVIASTCSPGTCTPQSYP